MRKQSFTWLLLILILLFCTSEGSIRVLAQESDSDDLPVVTIHVVQRGETLFSIAKIYETDVDELIALNGITNPGSIRVGQHLIVPETALPAEPLPQQQHVVRAGETLNSIAKLYNLAPGQIALANDIVDFNTIYVGQQLVIPSQNAPASSQQRVNLNHLIENGDTLFSIAAQYNTTVDAILEANNFDNPSLIYPGQYIVVPNVIPPQSSIELPLPITAVDILPSVFGTGQGGRIRISTETGTQVTGTFLDKPLEFSSENDQTIHTTFIGVPLDTSPGIYALTLNAVSSNGGSVPAAVNILIQPIIYDTDKVEIPDDLVPLLSAGVEQNELEIIKGITSRYNEDRYINQPMGLPAMAAMSSAYGAQRIYNEGAAFSIHNGADYAAAAGAPVLASGAGRVVLSDMLNIRGNSIIIDHGLGIYTNYSHMTQRNVQVGDIVVAGEVIGTVGSTGRSTGAHLHWELWIKGVAVDPMYWVAMALP